MHFTLKIWRQAAPRAKGCFEHYAIDQVDGDTSFLEMLDMLNNKLVKENKETIALTTIAGKESAGLRFIHQRKTSRAG